MKTLIKNSDGFVILEVILMVVVVAVIGLASWNVLSRRNASTQPNNSEDARVSNTGTTSSGSISFKKLITSGAPSNGQVVEPQLIKDQATFENIWKELYKDNTPPVMPVVDFSTDSVILVTYSASTGGYSVSLDKVSESSNGISVNYVVNKPGNNCGVTDALVLNYELVTIPTTNKTATFSSMDKTLNC